MRRPAASSRTSWHDVRAAHRPGIASGAGVRDDQQVLLSFAAFAIASATTRVHGATSTSTLVALDQLADVVGGFGRLGLVVRPLNTGSRARELAALLLHVELEAALDHLPQAGVGAGIGQHEADLDRAGGLLPAAEGSESQCGGGEDGEDSKRMESSCSG